MNTTNLRFRSNRMCDVITLYHEELDGIYGSGEVGVFVEMLCEEYLGWDKVKLLTNKRQTIDQSDLLRFHWALEDLLRQRPIQHIIGHIEFCGCRIEVGPDVLIPRPETEEMVQCIMNEEGGMRNEELNFGADNSSFLIPHSSFSILDLCTGSGCIAIALKKAFPQAAVTAVDISEKALAVARRNAEANGTDIAFLQADVLSNLSDKSDKSDPSDTFHLSPFTLHLIVSNPPYVRDSERTRMQRNVLDYDPALALFVPDDNPLLFYRAIASLASGSLAPGGMLALEINEALANETCDVLHGQGFSPTIHQDFRKRPRWITATQTFRHSNNQAFQ